jgi:flavin-dependent dehydrogenase
LVDAAAASGAEIRYGVRVDDLMIDDSGRVRGVAAIVGGRRQSIEADIVVGADGLHSTIAERAGAATIVEGRHAVGTLYSYWEDAPVDGYQWWFRTGGGVGSIPTNNRASCVFVSLPAARFRSEVRGATISTYRRLLREIAPAFAAQLANACQVEPVRGFGGHSGFIKAGVGPGWALVGDAGYFKDPITAHGITDALRDAELLARAIVRGTAAALAEYEAMRHDLSRRLFELTDEIASFEWTDQSLQLLHKEFSREMSREVRVMAALDPRPSVSPAGTAAAESRSENFEART